MSSGSKVVLIKPSQSTICQGVPQRMVNITKCGNMLPARIRGYQRKISSRTSWCSPHARKCAHYLLAPKSDLFASVLIFPLPPRMRTDLKITIILLLLLRDHIFQTPKHDRRTKFPIRNFWKLLDISGNRPRRSLNLNKFSYTLVANSAKFMRKLL